MYEIGGVIMINNDTLLERILEHKHSCHALLDSNLCFVRVNEAYARAVCKPVEFFPGKSYFKVRFPDTEETFQNVLTSGKSGSLVAQPIIEIGQAIDETNYWDCEIDPVFKQDGHIGSLLLTEYEVTEELVAERSFNKSKKLLSAINNAHEHYHQDVDPRVFLDVLMSDIIELTDSEYGFLGDVITRDDGTPCMKLLSLPNLPWTEQTKAFFDQNAPPNQEFINMDTLFGAVIETGEVVIANDPANDPRSGGLPEGHPPVSSFLCIPFTAGEKMLIVIGLANRPAGYSPALVEFLEPLLKAYNHLFNTYVLDTEKRQAISSLNKTEQQVHRLALPLIEYEHQELVELINECYAQIGNDTDAGMIEELLNEIYEGIEEHFDNEKELMENSDYPDCKEHLESHDRLLLSLREMINRFVQNPDEGVVELQRALAEWFGRHVSTLDQTLHNHFAH